MLDDVVKDLRASIDKAMDALRRDLSRVRTGRAHPSMLELFRTSRSHLAIVLGDDLKTAGIVTFEDVLEEIVGDIRDEFDLGTGPIFDRTTFSIVVAGTLTVRELQAETGWSFEWQPRETVSAWMVRHLGRLPRRDEHVTVGDYRLTAVEVSTERIRRLRVERIEDIPTL